MALTTTKPSLPQCTTSGRPRRPSADARSGRRALVLRDASVTLASREEAGVCVRAIRTLEPRPRGQSALARSEQAHDLVGLPLARQSERLAAPLELGVARRRGRVDASTRPRSATDGVPSEAPSAALAGRRAAREEASGSACPGCASARRRRISGKHGALVIPRVVVWVHHLEAANARCPNSTSRPARPAAANARGDARSAWANRARGPRCLPRARRWDVTGCRRRGTTGWWLRGNRRLIACEAWRSQDCQGPKCLQIRTNRCDHECPGLGLIRPSTAGFGPTNGPTASSATTSSGAALRR